MPRTSNKFKRSTSKGTTCRRNSSNSKPSSNSTHRNLFYDKNKYSTTNKKSLRVTWPFKIWTKKFWRCKRKSKAMGKKQPWPMRSTFKLWRKSSSKVIWFQSTKRRTSKPKINSKSNSNFTKTFGQIETHTRKVYPKPKTKSPSWSEDIKSSTIK